MSLTDCHNTDWSFKRIIFDRQSKQQRTAIGRAVITDDHFVESGHWTYPKSNVPILFHQSYRLVNLTKNIIQVYFDTTNQPFFELNLDKNPSVIEHVCGDDHYHGVIKTYCTDSLIKFYLGWRVKGPRKDYWMRSLYRNYNVVVSS